MICEERRFRRKVAPFEAIEVDVDLQDVLQERRGPSPAPYCHVSPLADWIEDEWVRLHVVSLPHAISRDLLIYVDAGEMPERFMSGGPSHRRLCALAMAYLIAAGKEPIAGGASSCAYAGGWADVIAEDGSLYVECGTLNTYKPIAAMLSGQTLMVVPYSLGCALPGDDVIERLDPFPDRIGATDASDKYQKLGRVQLGYVFEPKCALQPHPFSKPLGLRPAKDEE